MPANVTDWLPIHSMQESYDVITSEWRQLSQNTWTDSFMFAVLLLNEQLVLEDKRYFCPETAARDFCITIDAIKQPTTTAFVVCNDDFEQNTIDSEPISTSEIKELFTMWRESEMFGSLKWVALKRNVKPVKHRVIDMQKAGVWCDKMAALPERM